MLMCCPVENELQAALGRAVARAMVAGPRAGLAELDRLASHPHLSRGHLLPALRAELLRRLGRSRSAAVVFLQAASVADSAVIRASLRRAGVALLSPRPALQPSSAIRRSSRSGSSCTTHSRSKTIVAPCSGA